MKGHYKFMGGEVDAAGHVSKFRYAELHINRIPSLGLGRSVPGSLISGGLHALVDGETHFAPMTYSLEIIRNVMVGVTEAGYHIRAHYVY